MVVAQLRRVIGADIFSAGTHSDSTGEGITLDRSALDGMVRAFIAGVPETVPLKFGHTSPGFNTDLVAARLGVARGLITGEGGEDSGAIWPGRVTQLEVRDDHLFADFETLPAVADMVQEGLFQTVSVEMLRDFHGFPWVLSAVALLGSERPGVKDLAPLASAAIMREGHHPRVYSFSMGKPERVEDAPMIDQAEGALKVAILKAVQGVWSGIKGKLGTSAEPKSYDFGGNVDALIDWAGQVGFNGCVVGLAGKAGITDPESLCGWLKARAREKGVLAPEHQQEQEEQEDEMEEELRKILGLVGKADVLQAVRALKEGQGSQFSEARFTEELGKRDKEITTLKRAGRVSHYKEFTAKLTAVSGTTDELARRLVETEEAMGEPAAAQRLTEWQAAQQYAESAGILKAIGTAGTDEKPETHAFQERIQDYAAKHKVSEPQALAALAQADPLAFTEYHAWAIRDGG